MVSSPVDAIGGEVEKRGIEIMPANESERRRGRGGGRLSCKYKRELRRLCVGFWGNGKLKNKNK